jgi:prolyl-tRNA synthetase
MNQLGRPITAADTLKNVALKTRPPGSPIWELLVVGVPGDRDVDLKRLAGQLDPVEVATADAADLAAHPALVTGFIGPQILGGSSGVRYLVDPLVAPGTSWVTGANMPGRHAANVVRGRDSSRTVRSARSKSATATGASAAAAICELLAGSS